MEFKTMTQAELVEAITSGELDAVELNEAVGALKKITSKGIEDGKAQRVANVGLDADDVKSGVASKVSLLRERHGKVKFSGYIDFDNGGAIQDFSYGSKRGGPVAPSSFKGCTFRIDEQDSIIFSEANGSHLNFELVDGDVYPLNSCKRVWLYFGGQVRSDATKAEATATGKLAELTDEQRARVEVMKSGEAIALDDFLASLE